MSSGVLPSILARASASTRPGRGFSRISASWANMSWYISIWRCRTRGISGESGGVYTAACTGSQ